MRIDKQDERLLIELMAEVGTVESAWELCQGLRIPYKRARYIIRDKWCRKGLVDYGVSWRHAWLTEEGQQAAEQTRFCPGCEWEGMAEDLADGVEGWAYSCPQCGCTARGRRSRQMVDDYKAFEELKGLRRRSQGSGAKLKKSIQDLRSRLREIGGADDSEPELGPAPSLVRERATKSR